MDNTVLEGKASVFGLLPSIDELLSTKAVIAMIAELGRTRTLFLTRQALDSIRGDMRENSEPPFNRLEELTREILLEEAIRRLKDAMRTERTSGLRRVINATGVVIHTNLGRAPLSDNAKRAIAEAAGYCTLEYDIETGKRGPRGRKTEQLLIELTGAEDVLIVNNCAAAAFFVLTAFASGGEVVISRGELVEIGGDFRVPDVLTQSGAFVARSRHDKPHKTRRLRKSHQRKYADDLARSSVELSYCRFYNHANGRRAFRSREKTRSYLLRRHRLRRCFEIFRRSASLANLSLPIRFVRASIS